MKESNNNESVMRELEVITKSIYKITLSPYSDWKTRVYCHVFIAYLVNPDDVIPDKCENGFLDDLYLGLLIIKDLCAYRKDLLDGILGNLESIDDLIQQRLPQIEEDIGFLSENIKNFSGYSSLEYFDLRNQKVTALIKKNLQLRATLLGYISYCYRLIKLYRLEFIEISNKPPYYIEGCLSKITEYGDFFEIKRIIDCYESNDDVSMIDSIDINQIFFNYDEFIEKSKSVDKYSELYNLIPLIFRTLTNVFKDVECTWEFKHEINSALSYLAIIEDIIDDTDEDGFIDDLFLLSIVLLDIYNFNENIILRNLHNIKVNDLMYVIENCEMILNTRKGEVLTRFGLQKLLEFYELREISETNHINKYSYQITLRNSRLKSAFIDLFRIVFPNIKIDGKVKPETLLKQFKETIEYYHSKNSYGYSSDEKIYIDALSLDELTEIVDLSNKICYVANIEEEINREYDEKIKLLLLREKILGDYK
jgi:uncharacterized membrane protein YkvA (DUF1232 family)